MSAGSSRYAKPLTLSDLEPLDPIEVARMVLELQGMLNTEYPAAYSMAIQFQHELDQARGALRAIKKEATWRLTVPMSENTDHGKAWRYGAGLSTILGHAAAGLESSKVPT